MKLKLPVLITLFCLIGGGISKVQSQSLIVQFKDGTEKSLLLNSVSKITFSGTNMVLNYTTGTTDLIGESLVREMLFNVVSGTQNVLENETALAVYPNPVSDFIYLKNLPEGTTRFQVFSLDGALLFAAQVTSASQAIDVTKLAKGFYLLKVNNQTLKFIKL